MGGPKGINWEKALEFYLTPDEEGKTHSYQDVADKFGVSKKEVGLRAKRENWLQRRQNVYDLAEEKYVDDRITLINNTVREHIKMWRTVQELASGFLNDIDKKIKDGDWKASTVRQLLSVTGIMKTSIEGERTALGLPNTVKEGPPEVKAEVHLSRELIAEIDRLFMINSS